MEANRARALVDLSNVCRDEALGAPANGAIWSAFDQLTQALRELGVGGQGILAIADNSLRDKLKGADRQSLRQLEARQQVEYSSLADDLLLEYTFSPRSPHQGALVVTNDKFRDWRRRYPEIQGNIDRFIGWRPVNGRPAVYFRDMETYTHFTISRSEESAEIKERRLRGNDAKRRAMQWFYRCEDPSCMMANLWPDHLREMPRFDSRADRMVCPYCLAPLRRIGPRPRTTQVILFVDSAERSRILIEDNQVVKIGREDGPLRLGVARFMSDRSVADSISRTHIRLEMRGEKLLVSDAGSTNGTRLVNVQNVETPLTQRPEPFTRSAKVVLAETVWLERSGRTAPYVGERADPSGVEPKGSHPTRYRG